MPAPTHPPDILETQGTPAYGGLVREAAWQR